MAISDFDQFRDERAIEEQNDAQAEAELISVFSSVREREKLEVAEVVIPRYPEVTRRDPQGNVLRDGAGRAEKGPWVLYFKRVGQQRLMDLREEYTVKTPIRRAGRTEYDEKLDDANFALALVYTALLPWCRKMYFDNPRLWGEEPVGTGQEFLQARLTIGELGNCVDAVNRLEGLSEDLTPKLGKR